MAFGSGEPEVVPGGFQQMIIDIAAASLDARTEPDRIRVLAVGNLPVGSPIHITGGLSDRNQIASGVAVIFIGEGNGALPLTAWAAAP